MVRREKEGAEQLNGGEELRIGGGLAPYGYETDSGVDTSDSEILVPSSVEIGYGNPEVDAPRLLQLWIQPSVVEHLENIVPLSYTEIDPNTNKEKVIPATTVDDIRERCSDPSRTLLTARTPSGLIVGTCSVQKLSHNVADIGTLVVGRNYRRKGIGSDLIRAANALAFREDSGGLDCRFAQAFVIYVPGYHIAQDAFERQGYERTGVRKDATQSWSIREGRLVDRNSQEMTLQRKAYIRDFPGHHMKFFPGERAPMSA